MTDGGTPPDGTRRLTFEISLPLYLTASQLASVSRVGKSQLVESALSLFVTLTAIHAQNAGISQYEATRQIVELTPAVNELPRILEDPGLRGELFRILEGLEMTFESKRKDCTDNRQDIVDLAEVR